MKNGDHLQHHLGDLLQQRHCLLTGHGSTAIYLALQAIKSRYGAGEVIIPALACPSLTQVTLMAGFTPVFCDVNWGTYVLNVEHATSHINGKTRAILAVHLFGHPAPIAGLKSAIHGLPVAIIEDAAQSIGGRCDGKPMGAQGDFSILSFGGSKIVSAGVGGALAFQDSDYLETVTKELAQLPVYKPSERLALLALSHRNLYHGIMDCLRANAALDGSQVFKPAMRCYDELYLHRFPEGTGVEEKISAGLAGLDQGNAQRLEKALLYSELLQNPKIQKSDAWKESKVVWRFSFCLPSPETTIRVTSLLRRGGLPASNHYWSAADLFYQEVDLPNSDRVSRQIVNLWVDSLVNREQIIKACDIINSAMDERNAR